jgi:hypothetical protein
MGSMWRADGQDDLGVWGDVGWTWGGVLAGDEDHEVRFFEPNRSILTRDP